MSDCQKYHVLLIIVAGLSLTLLVVVAVMLHYARRSRKRQALEFEQRVFERTTELKKYVASLQRSQAERNFFLDSISKRINASIATMKGLGRIALTYENMPGELVNNIDVATDTMADILQQIAREKKL